MSEPTDTRDALLKLVAEWRAMADMPNHPEDVCAEWRWELARHLANELEAALARLPSSSPPEAMVAGERMERSLADFERACAVHIMEEQQQPCCDIALIGLLCDAVRLSREYAASATLRASAAPSGMPVAAQARYDQEKAMFVPVAAQEKTPSEEPVKRWESYQDDFGATQFRRVAPSRPPEAP